MQFSSILNPRKRKRYIKRALKKIKWSVLPVQKTMPIFVFGMQRSGTTMFMDIMENRPDMEVFQEWEKSVFDRDCRISDLSLVDKAVSESKAKYACFKPICDSHIADDFISRFPDGKVIWVYRSYLDNANSAIRRFPTSDRALRLICEGETGGGWLQEGVSDEVLAKLKAVYNKDLSKFEISCLNWWVRNIVLTESDWIKHGNAFLVKYDNLVKDPTAMFADIESVLGVTHIKASYSDVHGRSIAKNDFPPISPAIRELCEELSRRLDALVEEQGARVRGS